MPAQIVVAVCYEMTSPVIMARVRSQSGAYLTQSAISGITASVFDQANAYAPVLPAPVYTPAGSIYNTLQTTPRWTQDPIGYNCAFVIPPSSLPKGAMPPQRQPYIVEILLTPADGSAVIPIVAKLDSQRLHSYSQ
jgi:hypothetical protein